MSTDVPTQRCHPEQTNGIPLDRQSIYANTHASAVCFVLLSIIALIHINRKCLRLDKKGTYTFPRTRKLYEICRLKAFLSIIALFRFSDV